MKALPDPITGYWSVPTPQRSPLFPLLYVTALLDGSVVRRLVFGVSVRSVRYRAARVGTRSGHQVRMLQR